MENLRTQKLIAARQNLQDAERLVFTTRLRMFVCLSVCFSAQMKIKGIPK